MVNSKYTAENLPILEPLAVRCSQKAKNKKSKNLFEAWSSSSTQRAKLLAELRKHPVSTFYARRYLDVPHPAARIQELRMQGYEIITQWTKEEFKKGQPHHIASYVLLSEKGVKHD